MVVHTDVLAMQGICYREISMGGITSVFASAWLKGSIFDSEFFTCFVYERMD
jgi:hypothetical protein